MCDIRARGQFCPESSLRAVEVLMILHLVFPLRAPWRPRRLSTSLMGWLAAILTIAAAGVLVAADRQEAAANQSPSSAGECQTFRVRNQDQIWLVSTRHLGCPPGGKYEPAFQVWRYEKGIWQPRSEADFFAEDAAGLVTPLYIHGNQIDAGLASSY